MDKFLEKPKLPKLTHEEIRYPNSTITTVKKSIHNLKPCPQRKCKGQTASQLNSSKRFRKM